MHLAHSNSNGLTPERIEAHVIPSYDYTIMDGNPVRKFALTATELLEENSDDQIGFLIESLMQRVGLACLAGSSDTGKSCLLRQLAIAVATGADSFMGFKMNPKHKQAIYVTTEDGKEATRYLLRQQSKDYPAGALKGLRFIFDDEFLFADLEGALTYQPADVVILDCFQDVYGDDLRDSQKIRSFLHPYQIMAERHQCLFLFLHHTGKRTENFEPSKNNLLSGQGFEAKMRLVIELRADLVDPAQRHLCVVKGNYLPAAIKKESHVLHFDESTFSFTSTGERMPFELLVKQESGDRSKVKYMQAAELKKQGLSYREIAEKLGYSSKGTIAKLFEKGVREGWNTEAKAEEAEEGAEQ